MHGSFRSGGMSTPPQVHGGLPRGGLPPQSGTMDLLGGGRPNPRPPIFKIQVLIYLFLYMPVQLNYANISERGSHKNPNEVDAPGCP